MRGRPTRSRTRTSEVGARDARRYTTGLRKRTARLERAPPGWQPGALPFERRPRDTPDVRGRASGRSRTCAATVRRVRAALDTTEALKWRRQESNLHSLGASEVLSAVELRPRRSANGWSRTTTARGDGVTGRGARRRSAFAGRATDRIRTGTARITT